MDNGKVSGLGQPSQQQRPSDLRAPQSLRDRFLQALGSPSDSLSHSTSHASRAAAEFGFVSGGRNTDPLQIPDADQQPRRFQPEVTYAGFLGASAQIETPAPVLATAAVEPNTELAALLERICSAMYVGNQSASSQRVVLALDHVMPGAAAEIVRDGAHLSIRLHARTDQSYRLMSSQREALFRALGESGNQQLDVVVIHNSIDRTLLGDGHG